jgi:hypothetical protein
MIETCWTGAVGAAVAANAVTASFGTVIAADVGRLIEETGLEPTGKLMVNNS